MAMEHTAVEEAFRDYLINHLLPKRGVTISDCRLTTPPTGVKTEVRLLEFPDGKGVAIRIFPKKEKQRVRQLVLADEVLRKNNIPASRVIDSYAGKRKGRFIFVAEELLPGKTLHKIQFSQELIPQFAELIASLHKVKNHWWGELKRPGRGSFFDGMLRRVKHRLHSLRKHARKAIKPDELAHVYRWFRAWKDGFLPLVTFDLIHDKPNRGNFIFSDSARRFFMVDFATLQFGSKAKDLIQIYHQIFDRNKQLVEQFEDEYFNLLHSDEERMFRRLRPFFHSYYHLSQSAVHNKRDYMVKTYQPGREATFDLKFQYHWQQVNRLINEFGMPT